MITSKDLYCHMLEMRFTPEEASKVVQQIKKANADGEGRFVLASEPPRHVSARRAAWSAIHRWLRAEMARLKR